MSNSIKHTLFCAWRRMMTSAVVREPSSFSLAIVVLKAFDSLSFFVCEVDSLNEETLIGLPIIIIQLRCFKALIYQAAGDGEVFIKVAMGPMVGVLENTKRGNNSSKKSFNMHSNSSYALIILHLLRRHWVLDWCNPTEIRSCVFGTNIAHIREDSPVPRLTVRGESSRFCRKLVKVV